MATFNDLLNRANQISIAQITRSIIPAFVGDLFKDILVFFQNGFSQSNLKIEVKRLDNQLWIRHGVLPDNIDIVLLRKKRRGKSNGRRRPARPIKNYWAWAYKIKLSKGNGNNQWYIPTIISGDALPPANIGQNLADFIQNKIFVQKGNSTWKFRGVSNHFNYAKFAVATSQALANNAPKSDMAVFRFRCFLHTPDRTIIKSFSID
jgi:hypothetical protein